MSSIYKMRLSSKLKLFWNIQRNKQLLIKEAILQARNIPETCDLQLS